MQRHFDIIFLGHLQVHWAAVAASPCRVRRQVTSQWGLRWAARVAGDVRVEGGAAAMRCGSSKRVNNYGDQNRYNKFWDKRFWLDISMHRRWLKKKIKKKIKENDGIIWNRFVHCFVHVSLRRACFLNSSFGGSKHGVSHLVSVQSPEAKSSKRRERPVWV